jgi:hypothetical protein
VHKRLGDQDHLVVSVHQDDHWLKFSTICITWFCKRLKNEITSHCR